jgi:cell fate (sporulation/competence/biofilm development) regulator YlbF (YheA/YmcA/DUF963 family)
MDEIIEMAAGLGKRLAADPKATAYVQALRAVRDDPEAARIVHDFQVQAEKLGALEAEGKPIEPADKRRLMELQDRMIGDEKLKALQRAETDYALMMHHVNSAIEEPLAERLRAIESDA